MCLSRLRQKRTSVESRQHHKTGYQEQIVGQKHFSLSFLTQHALAGGNFGRQAQFTPLNTLSQEHRPIEIDSSQTAEGISVIEEAIRNGSFGCLLKVVSL